MPNEELLESVTSTMCGIYTSAGIHVITYHYSLILISTLLLILLTFKDVSDGRAPCPLGGGTVHLYLFHVDMNIVRIDALFRKKKNYVLGLIHVIVKE